MPGRGHLDDVARGQSDTSMHCEMDLDVRGYEAREEDVVRVHDRDEFAANQPEHLEVGAELPEVLVQVENAEARVVSDVSRDHVPAVVAGPVVDDEHFDRGMVLALDRSDGRADVGAVVPVDDHQRYEGRADDLCAIRAGAPTIRRTLYHRPRLPGSSTGESSRKQCGCDSTPSIRPGTRQDLASRSRRAGRS
jgi:hypothetical protein